MYLCICLCTVLLSAATIGDTGHTGAVGAPGNHLHTCLLS